MKKFLSTLVAVVASLGLVAGPAMAAQAYLLSDTELAGIWAGENTNTADNASIANQTPIHDNLNNNDVVLAGTNAANDGANVVDNPDGIAAVEASVSDSLGSENPTDSALANDGSTAARQNAQTGSGNLSDNPTDSAVAQENSQAANAIEGDATTANDHSAAAGNEASNAIDGSIASGDDVASANDGGAAATDGNALAVGDIDVHIEDIAIAGENAASGGSTAADNIVRQNVSESQNNANGINLSNALLSQIAQQSNVLSVSGSGSPHRVIQVNFNQF